MIVFRTYLALLRKHWLIILSYTSIFLLMTLLLGGGAGTPRPGTFERARMDAALSIPSGGHEAGDCFGQWLEESGHRVTFLSLSEGEAREAVFDHAFDVVFLFEPGRTAPQAVIDQASGSGYFAYMVAESYFRYLEAFKEGGGSYSPDLLYQVLAQEIEVDVQTGSIAGNGDSARIAFFSMFAYVLLLMSTTLVPLVNQSFSDPALHARTVLSPYPLALKAGGMMLGSSLVVFGTASALLLASFPLTRSFLRQGRAVNQLINFLLFALAVLALSYLLASLIRSKIAITAASTVLSLGMAFLSGAFVPQPLLGRTALTLAKGFPLYYYIHANHRIGSLPDMAADLIIQLCFAIVYFLAAILSLRLARRARRQVLA